MITKMDSRKNESIEQKHLNKESKIRQRAPKSKVCFSSLEVRYHEYELGDNPGGLIGGAPLTISWESFHSAKIAVNEYEMMRGKSRKIRPLSKERRIEILLRSGENMMDIFSAIDLVDEIKKQRKESLISRSNSFDIGINGEKIVQYFDKINILKRKWSKEKVFDLKSFEISKTSLEKGDRKILKVVPRYPRLNRAIVA